MDLNQARIRDQQVPQEELLHHRPQDFLSQRTRIQDARRMNADVNGM
jgi:hypothetical protein